MGATQFFNKMPMSVVRQVPHVPYGDGPGVDHHPVVLGGHVPEHRAWEGAVVYPVDMAFYFWVCKSKL